MFPFTQYTKKMEIHLPIVEHYSTKPWKTGYDVGFHRRIHDDTFTLVAIIQQHESKQG
jgi:hypothetical protein